MTSVLLGLGPAVALAQFSPGKLSRAHAALGGQTDCFKCHEPRKSTSADRCLACHRELGARIGANHGFHGLLDAGKRNQCGTCHAEHGGEAASLVSWPGGKREGFDHRLAGFVLTGKHATLRCDQCHKPDFVKAEDVRTAKSLQLATTHLGLATRCASCHEDVHHGQFAARVEKGDCASCHGTDTWKKPNFDHATARFALAGKHVDVACTKCHFSQDDKGTRVAAGTPGATVRYRPLGTGACVECHADPHQDRFGQDCARCHAPQSWKQLGLAGFDHSRTRYPLTGRHAQVECARCHWSQNAAGQKVAAGTAGAVVHYKPIGFASCTECHTDPHRTRFGADCVRCHATTGWSQIASGAFDHDKTRYPLRGRHVQVACEKCHRNGDFKATLAFQKCADCHRDPHRGQLAKRADGGACEACHGVEGFTPAHYGPTEHAATQFPLQGAHLAVACVACHRPPVDAPNAGFQFHFANQACAGCHKDPHGGQFAASGAAAEATDCTRCHVTAAWRIANFDHAKTRFPLEGAHKRTACTACHRPMTVAGRSMVRYRPLETACRGCHAEPMQPLGK